MGVPMAKALFLTVWAILALATNSVAAEVAGGSNVTVVPTASGELVSPETARTVKILPPSPARAVTCPKGFVCVPLNVLIPPGKKIPMSDGFVDPPPALQPIKIR